MKKKETEKMVKSSSKQVRTFSGLFVTQGMALKLESVIEKCPYYRGVSKKRLDCTY